MYLPTQYIGTERRQFMGRDCLSWNEIIELHQQGIRFGSHTHSHPRLVDLLWPEIEQELVISKKVIEDHVNESITTFAYPFAFPQEARHYTLRLARCLEAVGYKTCATTVVGSITQSQFPFFIPRLPVNSCDDRALFIAKLHGAYDWIHIPQRVTRTIRRQSASADRLARLAC